MLVDKSYQVVVVAAGPALLVWIQLICDTCICQTMSKVCYDCLVQA